jgi:cell division septation protein DedD
MRDAERLREKTQVNLDDRQMGAVAVGGLLLLGVVFALGLVIGKHLAAQSQPSPVEDAALESPPPSKPAQGRTVPVHVAQAGTPAEPPRAPPATVAPAKPVTIPPPPKPLEVAPAAEKEKPVVLTPPPKHLGDYTVQVGASQDRAEAGRIEQRARAAGLKPYAVEADLGKKGIWYRVRVGAFKDKEAADRYRKDVQRELRSAAVVMSTH